MTEVKTIGDCLIALGTALNDPQTTLEELVSLSKQGGFGLQFRLAPFQDTLYLLTGTVDESVRS